MGFDGRRGRGGGELPSVFWISDTHSFQIKCFSQQNLCGAWMYFCGLWSVWTHLSHRMLSHHLYGHRSLMPRLCVCVCVHLELSIVCNSLLLIIMIELNRQVGGVYSCISILNRLLFPFFFCCCIPLSQIHAGDS